MSAPTASQPERPPRKWYRWHASTWVVVFLAAAVMACVAVPGWPSRDNDANVVIGSVATPPAAPVRGRSFSWAAFPGHSLEDREFQLAYASSATMLTATTGLRGTIHPVRLDRGWPMTAVKQWTKINLLPRSSWFYWLNVEVWFPDVYWSDYALLPLLVDVVCVLVIVLAVGALFEFRRRRRSRLLQFSLIEMFVVMTAIAILVTRYKSETDARNVMTELLSLDVRICQDRDLPSFQERLFSPDGGLDAAHIRGVCAWRFKTSQLEFVKSNWTAASAKRLGPAGALDAKNIAELIPLIVKLPNLEYFATDHPGYKGDGLSQLGKLSGFTRLDVAGTKLSPQALAEICAIRQLTHLNLSRTPLEDADYTQLAELRNLQVLDISQTAIGPRGLAAIEKLHCLISLGLGNLDLAPEKIAALNLPPSLITLNISAVHKSSAALAQLVERLPNLKEINLINADVEDDLWDALFAHPNISKVHYRRSLSNEQSSRALKTILDAKMIVE